VRHPFGTALPGPYAAREYARQIVRELKEGGGNYPPEAALRVLDEAGETIHSVPF